MTIAEDIRAAARGAMKDLRETNRSLLAQLDEVRAALSTVMAELTDAREDVARFESELGVAKRELASVAKEHSEAIDHRNNLREVVDNMANALAARGDELAAMREMRDTWKRVAMAYRADRNSWAREYGAAIAIRIWSEQRRRERAAYQIPNLRK